MAHTEYERAGYVVSSDADRLDVTAVHCYLSGSYWAKGIPRQTVERAIDGSLCFGLYHGGEQVGFARVITDGATFGYLADVYVLEEHRGLGLGRWLVEVVLSDSALSGLRRILLATKDAHGLYERLGFAPLANPSTFMEVLCPRIYSVKEAPG